MLEITFKNGRTFVYTKDVLRLAMLDNDVTYIVDLDIGEVLKEVER